MLEDMEADDAYINNDSVNLFGSRSATCSSPASSCYESMKSDWSMDVPDHFKEGFIERSDSPSCLSLKSDWSMDRPINFVISLELSVATADHARCFVCSSILRDPVAIPCGHSFCMSCIDARWSRPGPAGEYLCPRCEKSYPARPELSVNEALNGLLQPRCAGPACDICSSETRPAAPAIKSCVECSVSYCEKHVRRHYTVPALQKHTLAPVNYP